MKKTVWVLLAALMSAGAAADAKVQGLETEAVQTKEKIVTFGTLENKNGLPTLEGRNEFSRLNGPRFCWLVNGLSEDNVYRVAITFQSPDVADFRMGSRSLTKSADGKQHTLAFSVNADRNGQAVQCWRFDSKDPLGTYQVILNISGATFGPFEFTLVP